MPSGSAATGALATRVSRSSSSSPSTRSFSAVEGGQEGARDRTCRATAASARRPGAVGQHEVLADGQTHEELGLLERPRQAPAGPGPGETCR